MSASERERKVRFGVAGLLGPEIEELLRTTPHDVPEALEGLHPADLAEIAEDLEDEDRLTLIRHLPNDALSETLGHLDRALWKDTVASLDPGRAAVVLRAMPPDERADAVGSLERPEAEAVLARLSRSDREETRRLLAYEEHSAGGLMTPDFVSFDPEVRASEALDRVRRIASDVETIYVLYVVDESGRLLGVLSLRDLLKSAPETVLRELMLEEYVVASVETDQEEVANLISKYDLFSLPVVNAMGRLLGIVTVDDVMDVLVEESTEDIQKIGAVAPLEGGYFQSSFWQVARNRAGWLGVLFLGVLLTTYVLEYFESTISGSLALVFFLPLIMATGGNSGSQSATLIIRGLALGDVEGRDAGRVATRELLTGLLMGSLLALIAVARALWGGEGLGVALVVGMAIVFVVTTGALLGGLLPLGIRRAGLDPAVVSSPLVTSLLDLVTIFVYFSVARSVLGL